MKITVDDIEELKTASSNLRTVTGKLSTALSDTSGNLINVDSSLSNLDSKLVGLNGAVTDFNTDLTEFESDLNTFDFQLNGDETHDGFADTLSNIQSSMSTLETKLDEFGDALADLDTGDTKLSLTLSQLTGYLTTFKGTLAEFRQKIIDDLGQSVYDGLDDQIIKLIGSITSANQDIEDHQDLIDGVQDMIGDPSDSASGGQDTLYGVLNDTSDVADTASQQASGLSDTIDNDLNPRINAIKNTDIPNLQNGINGVQTEMYGGEGYSPSNPKADSVCDRIDVAEDGIDDIVKPNTGLIAQTNKAIGEVDDKADKVISDTTVLQEQIYGEDGEGTYDVDNPSSDSIIGKIGDKNKSGTILYNIDVAQGDIKDAQDNISQAQSDISDVQADLDSFIQTNSSWQLLYIGSLDTITLNTLISSTGMQIQNIHYAYDGTFKINVGISWKSYDSSIILKNVDFASAVCDGFNQSMIPALNAFEIDVIYDLSEYCFYKKNSNNSWVEIQPSDYDYYQKTIVKALFVTTTLDYSSSLDGSVLLQSDVNNELYNRIDSKANSSHTHTSSEITGLSNWEEYESLGGIVLEYNTALRLVHFYGTHTFNVSTNEIAIFDPIPVEYRPKGDKIELCHHNLNYPTMVRVDASDGVAYVHSTNSSAREISFDMMWRY